MENGECFLRVARSQLEGAGGFGSHRQQPCLRKCGMVSEESDCVLFSTVDWFSSLKRLSQDMSSCKEKKKNL